MALPDSIVITIDPKGDPTEHLVWLEEDPARIPKDLTLVGEINLDERSSRFVKALCLLDTLDGSEGGSCDDDSERKVSNALGYIIDAAIKLGRRIESEQGK